MTRRIAILGTVGAHRGLAPFNDDEWEIWVCSAGNAYGVIPRVTRWFELHGLTDLKGPQNADWNEKYFGWLAKQPFPVYMQEPNDLIPQARIFPIRAWLKHFGRFGRINATSSIALMVGFAIMQNPEMIGIWGVDMSDTTEAYTNQKSGCLNMLDFAERGGIKVTIPLESCLATLPPLYGYAEASRMGMRLMVQEGIMTNVVNDAQAQANAQERRLYMARGALEQVQWFRRTFVDGEFDAEIGVEETEVEVGGQKATVLHGKGTTVSTEGGATAMRVPVRIPDRMGPDTLETEKLPSGLLVPKGKGNSGEHHAEE